MYMDTRVSVQRIVRHFTSPMSSNSVYKKIRDLKIIFKTATIQLMHVKTKHKIQVIYMISCDFGRMYVGETDKVLKV